MSELNKEVDLAWGEVVNVNTVPSRGVTRITIEIPDKFHVPATNLLFNKRALVIPWECPHNNVPYGVMQLSRFYRRDAQPIERPASGLANPPRPRNYVQQAAILCQDPQFWGHLTIRTGAEINSEIEAANALRFLIDVRSRSELAENKVAQAKFNELLSDYHHTAEA